MALSHGLPHALCQSASRRSLFKRLLQPESQSGALFCRPPGARPEVEFIDHCSRCDACLLACPTQVIKRGDGGFPVLDFAAAGCTGCGDCIGACLPKALQTGATAWPTGQVHLNDACLAEKGVTCQACKDACDFDVIQFPVTIATPKPIIDSDRCLACGECVSVCPVNSLSISPQPTPLRSGTDGV